MGIYAQYKPHYRDAILRDPEGKYALHGVARIVTDLFSDDMESVQFITDAAQLPDALKGSVSPEFLKALQFSTRLLIQAPVEDVEFLEEESDFAYVPIGSGTMVEPMPPYEKLDHLERALKEIHIAVTRPLAFSNRKEQANGLADMVSDIRQIVEAALKL
jgi:hypothetical protein